MTNEMTRANKASQSHVGDEENDMRMAPVGQKSVLNSSQRTEGVS